MVPWEADARTWHFTYVGPQALDLLGFPVEDWYDPSFWIRQIHPDDRAETISTCERLSAEGRQYEFEYRMLRSDGTVIWVKDVVAVEMGDAGPTKLKGFLIDITEQKSLADALERSEGTLRQVLQAVPDALLRVAGDGTIIECNRHSERLFGWSREELLGSPIERLLPERFAQSHASHRRAFAEHPGARQMGTGLELFARRRDGSEVPVEVALSPIDEVGSLGVLATVRDVSHQKRIESEVVERERRIRTMANTLPALIGVVDQDERYRFVNDKYATWFGVDPDSIVNRSVRDMWGEELYARLRPGIEAALRGEEVHYDAEFASLDGPRSVEVSLVPQYDVEGCASGYVVVVFDITDRVKAQEVDRRHREELAHVLRVATMGELASSLAHELNQPLAAIVTNAQAASRFLAATLPDLVEVDGALRDVATDAKRAGEVIRHMRLLLARGDRSDELLDVEALVTEIVDMLGSDAVTRNVSVAVECAGGPTPLWGDRVQLQQVVLNLVVNAFDGVSEEVGHATKLVIGISQSNGRIEISFSDDGPGLPDLGEDLFAPFVSSKQDGLGMGLSISRSIVEAHGGELIAENNSDGGACLRVLLPVTSRDESDAGRRHVTVSKPRGAGR